MKKKYTITIVVRHHTYINICVYICIHIATRTNKIKIRRKVLGVYANKGVTQSRWRCHTPSAVIPFSYRRVISARFTYFINKSYRYLQIYRNNIIEMIIFVLPNTVKCIRLPGVDILFDTNIYLLPLVGSCFDSLYIISLSWVSMVGNRFNGWNKINVSMRLYKNGKEWKEKPLVILMLSILTRYKNKFYWLFNNIKKKKKKIFFRR